MAAKRLISTSGQLIRFRLPRVDMSLRALVWMGMAMTRSRSLGHLVVSAEMSLRKNSTAAAMLGSPGAVLKRALRQK